MKLQEKKFLRSVNRTVRPLARPDLYFLHSAIFARWEDVIVFIVSPPYMHDDWLQQMRINEADWNRATWEDMR